MLREDLVQLRLNQVGSCVVLALLKQILFKLDGVTKVPNQDDYFIFSVDGDFMFTYTDEAALSMSDFFLLYIRCYHFFEESVFINYLRGC